MTNHKDHMNENDKLIPQDSDTYLQVKMAEKASSGTFNFNYTDNYIYPFNYIDEEYHVHSGLVVVIVTLLCVIWITNYKANFAIFSISSLGFNSRLCWLSRGLITVSSPSAMRRNFFLICTKGRLPQNTKNHSIVGQLYLADTKTRRLLH